MIHCFARGAGFCLRYSKSLTFEGIPPPSRGYHYTTRDDIAEQDLLMNVFLQIFSDQDIDTVRYENSLLASNGIGTS